MAEVFAGFVCGYGLALAVTPVLALALLRMRSTSATVRRVMPEGTPLAAASILLHTFAFLVFTAIGLLLGMVLWGLEDNRPDGGLGSPNLVFTAFVLAATAIAFGPMLVVLSRVRLPLAASALAIAAVFGWLLPYLALIGPGAD